MHQLSFERHRFPPDIIRHAIWLYARFTLSFRDVEEMLAERSLDVSYETVRRWFLKFGSLSSPPICAVPARSPAIIGTSMRFLTRQARNVAKLMSVSAPDALVSALAEYKAIDPNCGIAGAHMYPLGGLRRSAKWSYAVTDGLFTMNEIGKGFTVDVDLG